MRDKGVAQREWVGSGGVKEGVRSPTNSVIGDREMLGNGSTLLQYCKPTRTLENDLSENEKTKLTDYFPI